MLLDYVSDESPLIGGLEIRSQESSPRYLSAVLRCEQDISLPQSGPWIIRKYRNYATPTLRHCHLEDHF